MEKIQLTKIKYFLKKHWKLIFTIIYVISPIDLIPDVILPLGYSEDILLVITMLMDYYIRKRNEGAFDFKDDIDPVDGEVVDEK